MAFLSVSGPGETSSKTKRPPAGSTGGRRCFGLSSKRATITRSQSRCKENRAGCLSRCRIVICPKVASCLLGLGILRSSLRHSSVSMGRALLMSQGVSLGAFFPNPAASADIKCLSLVHLRSRSSMSNHGVSHRSGTNEAGSNSSWCQSCCILQVVPGSVLSLSSFHR